MNTPWRIAASLLVLSLAGCPQEPPTPAESDVVTDPRQERATAAAKALGGSLKARLQAAVAEGGLSAGVEVCQVAAPEIAAAVGSGEGLRVGRTSHRLRNPANQPPAWAEAWVAERREEPAFVDGPDGSLRALLPIRTEALCVSCHGPSESLASEVQAVLSERYPEDQATGFQAGDLRGWFWVEVPGR